MKSKTKIVATLVALLAVFTVVFMAVQAFATDSKYLNILGEREGDEVYKLSNLDPQKTIWKIVSFDSMNPADLAKYEEAIYCINPEIGFGSATTAGNDRKEYNASFNMKDLTNVEQKYRDMFATMYGNNDSVKNAKYNSILWILDNSYLPKQTPNSDKEKVKSALYEAAGITRDVLTDNDIEVVQQMALWYFASDNPHYHYEPENFPTITLNDVAIEQIERMIDPLSTANGQRYNDMKKLYEYFITSAQSNQASYGTSDKRALKTPSISFTTPADNTMTEAETINGVDYYIAGPYKFTETNGTKLSYLIEGTVADQDGNTIEGYKLFDNAEPKAEIASTEINKSLLGQDFYIAIPKTNNTATKIVLTVKAKYFNTGVTVWTHSDNYATEQPVVIVEKEPDEVQIEKEVTVKQPEFDLSLRKFITELNGEEIEVSRKPQVSVTDLVSKEHTTATYTHSKTPLQVKTGDLVTYTIRVYNEGEVSGYAKEITDYIPEGLEYIVNDPTNVEYKWELSNDEKSVTTHYLEKDPADDDNLIVKFDAETMTEPAYKEVKVVFKVTEPNASKRVLVNIAEISDDTDENENEVNDRDSVPNNVDLDNYNPPADNSTYQQDDDDYEQLVLSYFDLSLRKFITKVNDTDITTREPQVKVDDLKDGKTTTATYTHPKTPVSVKTGDIVIYTIRVYNEGEISGYAEEVIDNIPEGLEYVKNDPVNIEYMWKLSDDGKKITTSYLSKEVDEENVIAGFDKETMTTLEFKDLKVAFKVTEPNNSDRILVNIAEISKDLDEDGNEVDDIDSTPNNNKDGEDDIDKEYLKLDYFDLSLRKFISRVNRENITNREPEVTRESLEKLANGTETTATYTHPKTPVAVRNGDNIIYTIRIYNEGKIDGTATEVTDYIPEGLKFLSNSTINETYGWKLLKDGKTITTNYLANTVIKAFDKETKTLDYKDVLVEFEVIEPNTSSRILRNIAEITDDSGDDDDSTPKNVDLDKYNPPADNSTYQEDDDDYEQIKLQYFDLSLRKFITKVNSEEVTTRYPVVTINEDGELVYTHTKEPVLVANNNIVVYTIRVFNEGTMAGYAKEITDDIPAGLSYLPEHEINKKYEWVLSEDGKSISTDYLSKEKSDEREENNLLKAFDKTKDVLDGNPDYRDVQIAFKVTETNLASDRIIINTAEITDDSDENGKDVTDEDSTPGNNEPDEDDIDKEYLKVRYFDLSLLKWVSKAYVTENGKTTVTETGHTGLENPEPVVKVDLDRKNINKVTVKFGYTIKITNEGEIAGYAKEISDYIPQGLKFVKSDNPDWEEKDGKIVTRKLEKTLLQPGESATVEVILTWINDGDNIGLKVNVAEISEDYNEDGAKDIDSTPNNKKDGEDDIDDAPVLLTIKTGSEPTYIILTITSLAILATGIILIKKIVLK